jgi:glycosyltransferase involved in cell wall biosynthesis
MKKLAIGFEPHIYLMGNDGPKAFMKRLKSSIKLQDLAKVRSSLHPFYQLGLFKNTDKSLYKKPYVLRADGIYFDVSETLGSNNKLNEPIFRSIENATGIVFVSAFSRTLIETFFKPVDKPNVIIHNAVDTNIFKPGDENMRDRIGISRNDKVIITSAHWRKWKRLEDLVNIFLEFTRNEKQIYHLLILGGNPDFVIDHEKIHYIGEVNAQELPRWYRTGDVYLHMAWLENCGNTQIEAMACGLPVLCTNQGGIGETVSKADGGIVSKADRTFQFKPVDLYQPPRPEYQIVLKDLKEIFKRLEEYKRRIQYEEVSIDIAARRYCEFMAEVFHQKNDRFMGFA